MDGCCIGALEHALGPVKRASAGSLLALRDFSSDLQGILPEAELRALLESNHRPNYVLSVLSCAIEVSS